MNREFFKVHEVLSESLEIQTCRATLLSNNRACIVRLLKPFKSNDHSLRKLQEEYSKWIKLSHKGFARVIAAHMEFPKPCIILADPGFELLSSYYLQGVLKPYEAVKVAIKLLEALMYLHEKGIILQTLSSSDILFNRSTGEVKLICLEKRLPIREELYEESNEHIFNDMLLYMDPAIIVQPGAAPDVKSDLYTLGVIMYELLLFRSLFGYSTYKEIISAHLTEKPYFTQEEMRTLPFPLIEFIHTLLAKKPRSRFHNASEALDELNKIYVQIKALIEE